MIWSRAGLRSDFLSVYTGMFYEAQPTERNSAYKPSETYEPTTGSSAKQNQRTHNNVLCGVTISFSQLTL